MKQFRPSYLNSIQQFLELELLKNLKKRDEEKKVEIALLLTSLNI